MENLIARSDRGRDMCICMLCGCSRRRHRRHAGRVSIRCLSDPSGLSWSMTQSGSTPRQEQPECGQVNLPSRYPWIARESPRKTMSQRCSLCYIHIYISALCRNTRGCCTPAHRPEVWSSESRVRRARERRAEKVSDETGDVRIDESVAGEGKEGRERAVLKKLTTWSIREIKHPLRI